MRAVDGEDRVKLVRPVWPDYRPASSFTYSTILNLSVTRDFEQLVEQ